MRLKHFVIIGIVFLAAALAAIIFKPEQKIPLPQPKVYVPLAERLTLPTETNLDIPFTSQAPLKIWDETHEEFCEEASVFMASYYIMHKDIPSPEYADEQLNKIKNWEEQTFGYYKDTNAEETARILREYYMIKKVEVVFDPTLEQIKQSLAEGRAVLVPSAGRLLPNPNYRSPGPLYHMLVLKGYTRDGTLITNDPGTRKGADFIFEATDVMNAMHDWNGGDVEHGRKVMIIVG